MPKLDDVAEITDTSPLTISNWLRRLKDHLKTEYDPPTTGPGNGRNFSRDNCLELALVAALARQRFSPQAAAEDAAAVLNLVQDGKHSEFVIVHPAPHGGLQFEAFPKTVPASAIRLLADENDTLTMINVARIIARVDRFIADKERQQQPSPQAKPARRKLAAVR